MSITVGSNVFTLVPLPTHPGLSDLEVTMDDAIAVVSSPFNPASMQTQQWVGADAWGMTITLPKMPHAVAAPWRGFLAALQGMLNVFQIGDPFGRAPLGVATGTPVCSTAGTDNATGSNTLMTQGWTHSTTGILKAGDYIQVVNRLYQVTHDAASDSYGSAAIPVWPSLRETPADATALVLNNTVGVFRLAQNQRSWHSDFTRLTQISFKVTEVR